MGTKTLLQPPYSPDLAPCDFWLFPKLRGCRYETIEEMKEAVMKVIDMLTQEDLYGALQKLLERYKCIAAGGDYFKGDESFMCVLSIKVAIRKKSGKLLHAPCINVVQNQKHFIELLFLSANVIKEKLATVVKGDPKAPFTINTTPWCRGGHYSIPWIALRYP